MIGCLKAEFYKIIFNISCYFCYFCIFVTSIIGLLLIDPKIRTAREIELFSYIFLLICNLIVGSIIANEYSGTFKDRIVAVGNRRNIFVSKVIMSFISISCIYFFYVAMFVVTNKGVQVNIFINQYEVIIQHTCLLIGIAVIVKSFSSLSVATVIILCLYKELAKLSNLIMGNPIESILKKSYFVQFMSMDKLSFNDCIFCVVAIVSVVVGYVIFEYQDIK